MDFSPSAMLALNGLVARLGNSIWRAGHVSTHPLTNKRGTREGAAPGASAAIVLGRSRRDNKPTFTEQLHHGMRTPESSNVARN